MRGLLRGCAAPDLYWAEIPVHDPKTCTDGHMKQFENLQREKDKHSLFSSLCKISTDGHMRKLPFLLPHELLHKLLQKEPSLLATLTESPLLPGEFDSLMHTL